MQSNDYKQGYFQAWLSAYDELVTILARAGISVPEKPLSQVDAWVESDLAEWSTSQEKNDPPRATRATRGIAQ